MKRWSYVPLTDAIWKGLRKHDITSTESAALFGSSPYLSRFQLWQQKKTKEIIEIDGNIRTRLGQKFERYVAEAIGEEYGVKVRKVNQYSRIVEIRMGASYDFEIIGLLDPWDGPDTALRKMYREHGAGNLEIKCVDRYIFKERWTKNDDGSIDAPPHIEIQLQHQLHVKGRPWAAFGVLVGGNELVVLIRQRYEDVGNSIEWHVSDFWRTIKENCPPPPEYPADANFVKKLYGYAEPGKLYDAANDDDLVELVCDYSDAQVREKLAAEDKRVAQAKIFERIGEAERAVHPLFSIWAGVVGPTHIEAFDRSGFRSFKLTRKKEKKNASQDPSL